jgi:predicted nucleic acid-binding protein
MSLVDTNVLSEVRHPRGSSRVKEAFLALGNDLSISVIVLGEIRYGAQIARDVAKRAELLAWYAMLNAHFSHRVLPVTIEVAEAWGDLVARQRGARRRIEVADGLIAATALVHDLTLWTRNTRDFDGTGVRLFNPWED